MREPIDSYQNMRSGEDERRKEIMADVLSRSNAIAKRYSKGKFGLDFYHDDDPKAGSNVILARANMADDVIANAESRGYDIDDVDVLGRLGRVVNDEINKQKYIGRTVYFAVAIIIAAMLYLLI